MKNSVYVWENPLWLWFLLEFSRKSTKLCIFSFIYMHLLRSLLYVNEHSFLEEGYLRKIYRIEINQYVFLVYVAVGDCEYYVTLQCIYITCHLAPHFSTHPLVLDSSVRLVFFSFSMASRRLTTTFLWFFLLFNKLRPPARAQI